MSKEHLSRGKRKDNGEWIEGSVIHIGNRAFICKEGMAEVGDGYKIVSTVKEANGTFLNIRRISEIIPETAGQYAGLTDKNGKRIFDGDIVKKMVKIYPLGKNEPVGERMLVGVVICEQDGINPECWLIESKDEHGNRTKYIFDNSYEVIGNIHDNPELLEVE